MIEHEAEALALSTQAELLSISRNSLYYQPTLPSPEEVALKHRIDELYTAHPFYGSRKLSVLLTQEGRPINRKRVQRYMREMGIQGIGPGPNLSKRLSEHRVYPYLLRNLTAERPNQIWGCDITYIRLRHGWLYLVAILDWWSRYVVSWQLDQTLELGFVLEAIAQARAMATPELEYRSRKPLHQPAGHTTAACRWCADQHGWKRTRLRQHFHRTAVAECEV